MSLTFSLLVLSLLSPPKEGDFIFQSLACGALCDGIEEVTKQQFSTPEPALSHLGVVAREADKLWVFESIPPDGVTKTPLQSFISRTDKPQLLGRLKPSERERGKKLIEQLEAYIGSPYDPLFLWDNRKFYCSELIFQGLQDAGFRPRNLRKMYFGLPDQKNYASWVNYYSALNTPVPRFEKGVSPLGIYLWGKDQIFDEVQEFEGRAFALP